MSFRLFDWAFLALCYGAALVCIGLGAVKVVRAATLVRDRAERFKTLPIATHLAAFAGFAPRFATVVERAKSQATRAQAPLAALSWAFAVLGATATIVRTNYHAVRSETIGLRADVRSRTGL